MDSNSTQFKQSNESFEIPDHFYLLLGGHIFFQTLSAAVQFDLFGLLKKHGPITRAEIAEQLGIEEQPARILLLGCTALGLVSKSKEHYSNTELAERLLVRDTPGNLVSVIEWQHHINYRPMVRFYEALKSNKNVGLEEIAGDEDTLYARLAHDSKLETIFQEAMQSISMHANEMLLDHLDLTGVNHLVDVGGGNGTNAIAAAERFPHLRATVFDSPSVCEIAQQNMRQSTASDRLDTFPGNCFADPYPKDADCYLYCHFFTIWSEQKNRTLLQKTYDALPPGGRVIIFNMMQDDSEEGPLTAAMGSPYFLTLATGEGMLYTGSEYETWVRAAGFAHVKRLLLPKDHGAIIGTK